MKDRTLASKTAKKTLKISEQHDIYVKEFLKDVCGIIELGALI